MAINPSPGNSISIRIRYLDVVGKLASVAGAISLVGGSISHVEVVGSDRFHAIRDVTINTTSESHADKIVETVKSILDVEVVEVADCTFRLHEGGKLVVNSKTPLKDYADLSMAYTPGVARVSSAIHKNPALAREYTIRRNTVAVVTNGTAVLGLGNIGAVAALPVMEGKAVLFKEFGGVNSFPICFDTQDNELLFQCAKAVAATFGGINLEDIAAPACFELERRLTEAVDIPVFHDDQHGTAVVVGAAFTNAVRLTGKKPENMRAVVAGAGAAGAACTRTLLEFGVGDVVVCDRKGAISKTREDLTPAKRWLAEVTNKNNLTGSVAEVLVGADLFLGLSGPNILTGAEVRKMNKEPIVFALSNPTPEVPPEEILDFASVVATGRSDYPNQINNVLCFPGLFRGLLATGVKRVTREMLAAAAKAIASVVADDELEEDFIVPSVFDPRVGDLVASAVAEVANDETVTKTPIYFDF